MDDTPTRVGSDAEMSGRGSDEITGRSDESVQDYSATDRVDSAPADDDSTRRTSEIRRDIEHTREELSETIDAIQEKLRPANIVSNATDTIKHATTERVRHMARSAGEAANNMMYGSRGRAGGGGFMDNLRENPYPAALIGIGAAWLYLSRRSAQEMDDRWDGDDDRFRSGTYDRGVQAQGQYGADRGESGTRGIDYAADYSRSGYPRSRSGYYGSQNRSRSGGGFLARVRENPVPAAMAGLGLGWLAFSNVDGQDWGQDDNIGNRHSSFERHDDDSMMSQVSEKASDMASGIAEGAQEMTSRAQEYAHDATQQVRRTGRRAQNELQRMTQENPLAVGAGALLLGAIVGLTIPETERENEMLGETRDAMLDKAQEVARTATSRAQDAAADLVGDAASRIVTGKTE